MKKLKRNAPMLCLVLLICANCTEQETQAVCRDPKFVVKDVEDDIPGANHISYSLDDASSCKIPPGNALYSFAQIEKGGRLVVDVYPRYEFGMFVDGCAMDSKLSEPKINYAAAFDETKLQCAKNFPLVDSAIFQNEIIHVEDSVSYFLSGIANSYAKKPYEVVALVEDKNKIRRVICITDENLDSEKDQSVFVPLFECLRDAV